MTEMKKTLSPRKIFERSIKESDVVGAIRTLLELNGARVFEIVERIPWGRSKYARKSEAGIPDLHGWFYRLPVAHPGLILPIHFWIEVKKPNGLIRPSQFAWIEQARADAVIAMIADSVEKMVAGFKEYGITIKGV